jgi:hypothetical protein
MFFYGADSAADFLKFLSAWARIMLTGKILDFSVPVLQITRGTRARSTVADMGIYRICIFLTIGPEETFQSLAFLSLSPALPKRILDGLRLFRGKFEQMRRAA